MTGAYLVELDPIEDTDQEHEDDRSLLAGPGPGSGPYGRTAAPASHLSLDAVAPSAPTPPPGSQPQSLRYYFVLDQLQHPAVKSMPCSKFFYHCWQHGFHFDVDHRQVGRGAGPCRKGEVRAVTLGEGASAARRGHPWSLQESLRGHRGTTSQLSAGNQLPQPLGASTALHLLLPNLYLRGPQTNLYLRAAQRLLPLSHAR
jgi:hypothetical protein